MRRFYNYQNHIFHFLDAFRKPRSRCRLCFSPKLLSAIQIADFTNGYKIWSGDCTNVAFNSRCRQMRLESERKAYHEPA